MLVRIRLIGFFLLFSSMAKADCSALASWLEVANAPAAESASQRMHQDQVEWNERLRAAESIFQAYREGRAPNLTRCLKNSEQKGNFRFTLQRLFVEKTLERLSASRGPTLKNLVQILRDRQESLVFHMTGHFEKAPVDKKAGFHRGSQGIFMDIDAIPANEWPLIFVHEVLHGLDEELYEAVKIYAESSRVERRHSSDPADQKRFDEWLEAGLSRGLWGEYRAWYFTALIYREGLRDGLWKKISWMDGFLGSAQTENELTRRIYNQLDARFEDPREGIFVRPEVSRRLKEIRGKYRSQRLPPLGHLQKILEPK